MSNHDDLLRANAAYVSTFDLGDLAGAPARRLSVVTCMDARIDPLSALGLRPGEAHVIRNAGAIVTEDVLRSLAISHWELGTQEAAVIGHTGCGMTSFTNETLTRKLSALGVETGELDFLPFRDVAESVREGVRRIEASPLLPEPYAARGFVYDVSSGALEPLD
jgi:carbonic anhydrase